MYIMSIVCVCVCVCACTCVCVYVRKHEWASVGVWASTPLHTYYLITLRSLKIAQVDATAFIAMPTSACGHPHEGLCVVVIGDLPCRPFALINTQSPVNGLRAYTMYVTSPLLCISWVKLKLGYCMVWCTCSSKTGFNLGIGFKGSSSCDNKTRFSSLTLSFVSM